MRRSGKSCFFGSYLHPQFAMGPRHSQEPSWVSGVNKISEERGRCACAYAQNGSIVTRGESSRPISVCPDPKPASVTTGDNNNTISTIMTFIKCLSEGQPVGCTDHMVCVSRHPLTASSRFHYRQLSFDAFHCLFRKMLNCALFYNGTSTHSNIKSLTEAR